MELIKFKSKKKKKLDKKVEKLREEDRLMVLTGYIKRKDGTTFILQGFYPEINLKGNVIDLNNFNYVVNNSLVTCRWEPREPIPLDKDYFLNVKKRLSRYNSLETRVERSEYLHNRKPCMVIYTRKPLKRRR